MTLSEYFESLDPYTVANYPENLRAAHDYLCLAYQLNDLSDYPRVQMLVKEYLEKIGAYFQQKKAPNEDSQNESALNAPSRIEKKRSAILDTRLVNDMPRDAIAIKKYTSFHQRKVSKEEVRSLLNYIRRARLRGEINEKSEFFEEVKSIQQKLVIAHQKMGNSTVLEIENYAVLILLTHPIKLRHSVLLLKRYIGLGDKKIKNAKEKARELLQNINNSLREEKITSNDPFFAEIKDARETLQAFMRSSRKTLPIVEASLYGLEELSEDLERKDLLAGLSLCNEDEY